MTCARQTLAILVGVGITFGSVELGCGSTGSKRFAFEARAGGVERDVSSPFTFTNGTGWTITLSKANVTLGPVYLNVVSPVQGEVTGSRSRSWIPFVRSAHADATFLGEGRVVGEVLGQITIDALAPTLVAFPTQGEITQERVRTADVWYWPPPGVAPETTNLDTAALDLAGVASRGNVTVRFRGTLVIDADWATDAKPGEISATPISETRQVRGVPASFFPEEGGALELRFDVRPLFRGADFSNLGKNPTDRDGTVVLVQGKTGTVTTDQVLRNVFQGLRATRGTYTFRWTMP